MRATDDNKRNPVSLPIATYLFPCYNVPFPPIPLNTFAKEIYKNFLCKTEGTFLIVRWRLYIYVASNEQTNIKVLYCICFWGVGLRRHGNHPVCVLRRLCPFGRLFIAALSGKARERIFFILYFRENLTGKAQAEATAAERRRVEVAGRHTAVPGRVAPAAATDHAARGR